MRVSLWGTRGSIAACGPSTHEFGGNTSCVVVVSAGGAHLILDAGTGIRRAAEALPPTLRRVDILLTHLHMDHIQGLGFFAPLYDSRMEIHIWGPDSPTQTLAERLGRYLAPPLFPVMLRDLPCDLHLHAMPSTDVDIADVRVSSAYVVHPGRTVGYRLECGGASLCYLPDHEPALGAPHFPLRIEWTSGASLAHDVDLLIHDGQYTSSEYAHHVGWGHSSMHQAIDFAQLCRVRRLLLFHHDPGRSDAALERELADVVARAQPRLPVAAAVEGTSLELRPRAVASRA